MRKRYLLCGALLLALTLSGCQPSVEARQTIATVTPETTCQETMTVPQSAETSEDAPEGDAATYYIRQVYAEQIAAYKTALSEKWEESAYYEHDMSPVAAAYYEGDPLENVGFGFADLDGDGTWELLIGATKEAVLFEAWTADSGQPVKLFTAGYRNRYALVRLEEGGYLIANEGSSSAASNAHFYYTLRDGALALQEGVMFDASADPEHPWFLTYDEDWDVSNDIPVEEDMAQDIIDSFTNCYTIPEYLSYGNLQ